MGPQKIPSFFVCGTDTGVGKTLVAGALLAAFNKLGLKGVPFKPAESGCRTLYKKGKPILIPKDGLFLKKLSHSTLPLEHLVPYRFKEALAPGVAAQRAGQKISLTKIKTRFLDLKKNHDLVIVEGAGGLLVPFSGLKTNLDLIQILKLPVLVVGRLGLGTINHTLLTLKLLQTQNIPILGVVLNQTTKTKSIADKTNPQILKQYKVPLIQAVPYCSSPSEAALASCLLPVAKKLLKYS